MEYNLEKHNFLIIEWFNNVLKGEKNDEILFLENEILFLENVFDGTKNLIRKLLKEHDNALENKYIITNEIDCINNFCQYKDKSIILFQSINKDVPKLIGFQRLAKQKLLFVPKENNFYTNMEKYIDSKNIRNYSKTDISKKERYLYYIEKVDPLDLILNKTKFELESFLKISIKQNLIFWKYEDRLVCLINKTSFKIESFDSSLSSDIVLLKDHKILTSRLAVVIYRITNLNLDATTTAVGRYFHKKLGSKSKTSNYKLIIKYNRSDNLAFDPDLSGKNFKAYDLLINESEVAIRKEIAENLVNLKKYALDADTISKVTKLPIEEIEKLIK